MKDPEFIELRNKFLLALLVALIFSVPIFFIFKNKLVSNNSIEDKINNNKNIVLYIVEDNCINCNKIKKYLDSNKIKYNMIYKNSNDYQKTMNTMGVNKEKIISPAIMYIEETKLKSYIVDIKSEKEAEEFINNYKLSK